MVFTALSDVTLTMIVRDELMNPAGGLHAVLSRHLPYFQNVIVLDTGSVDGTRQLLEQMAGEYPQLKVYDAKFEGYGPARNTAKGHVKTKYTLMLDADEMIEDSDLLTSEIKTELEQQPGRMGLSLKIRVILPSGKTSSSGGWNPRLFQQRLVRFEKKVWENLTRGDRVLKLSECPELQSSIYHFTPSKEDWRTKNDDWYSFWNSERGILKRPIYQGEAPSQTSTFPTWKTPNPAILLEYGIDTSEEIEYLEKLGLRLHPGIRERLARD